MKFRLSRQRQANVDDDLDLKTICPSLRDDPAFSADLHSNPYFVTSHNSWLSPPPLGHPVLKNNNSIVSTPHDTDSDFHLIQPSNIPVVPSGSRSSPQQPFSPTKQNTPTTPSSLNQGLIPQGPSLLPQPKKEKKKMNLLSRRQSAQPQPAKPFLSFIRKKGHRRSDLSGDTDLPPQPVQQTKNLPTSASVAPQTLGRRGRMQDLDQIDELDGTNPWGIRIHHDGPYEAANLQVFKRVSSHVPLGLASSNGLHNVHALQANGQTYIPPQAPSGVSLNLSPGQILPRQFLVPFVQPVSTFSMLPGPYTPHVSPGPPLQETIQHGDDLSFNIGMAMLEPETNALVSSPRVFLSQAELPNEQDFNPYDSVNLESEHRQIPVSAQPEPSRSQANQDLQNAGSAGTSLNKLDVFRPAEHLQDDSDPPMYSEDIDDEDAGHRLANQRPSYEQQQLQSSPQASQNLAGTGLQQHSTNRTLTNDLQNVNSPPEKNISRPPDINQEQRVEVVQETQHTSHPSLHSHRDSSVNHRSEPDAQSTSYSTSTYSSSQFQDRRKPPPNRHLPKRLVMPAPLNTGPSLTTTSLRVPQSQGNVKQTHFQPTPFNSLHRSPLGNIPMVPTHYHGNIQTGPPVTGARKLRKRASSNTPTPASVIATVSFAPPIIGLHDHTTRVKGMAHSETEKIPKKLLSKRKT